MQPEGFNQTVVTKWTGLGVSITAVLLGCSNINSGLVVARLNDVRKEWRRGVVWFNWLGGHTGADRNAWKHAVHCRYVCWDQSGSLCLPYMFLESAKYRTVSIRTGPQSNARRGLLIHVLFYLSLSYYLSFYYTTRIVYMLNIKEPGRD